MFTKQENNKDKKIINRKKKRISPSVTALIGTIIIMIGGFFLSYNYVNTKKVMVYVLALIITGILLFIIGELLGDTLENLCNLFGVSEVIVGILLGFVTSLPELITFFEAQRHYKKVDDDMLGVVEATNNLLTSNILNLFAIQTIGILISAII